MDIKRTDLSCDVLIAGGGVGGLSCAVELKEQNPNLDIIIIEKQFAGYGGKANKGGGVLQYFNDNVNPMEFLGFHANLIGCFLGNQNMLKQYMGRNHELLDKLSGWGVNVPKNDDGTYNISPTGPLTSMICVDLDICLQIRRRAEKLGVKIYDKTTVCELYKGANGEIAGAGAYSILDGEFFVVRAKRVVLATGSQNYRIASMWSNGRGDGIAAAYRIGAEMRNAEFGNFSQLMKVKSHNEVVFGENYMFNAKNENITKNFRQWRETDINANAIAEWYKQMQEGNGPVHLDYGDEPHDEDALEKIWYRPYGKKFRDLNTQSANTVDTDLEVCPLFVGEQSPVRVEEDMQTSIKGLYAIGDVSYSGSAAAGAVPAPPGRNRGSGILNAVFAAVVCGESIAKEPDIALPELDEKMVQKSIDDAFAPLNRKSGHTAKEVIELVQKAMMPSEYSVVMSAENIAKAEKFIDEAEEAAKDLYAEDLHGMLSCHEAEAMVLSARMHYTASKLRKESRGWFYRTDYPETDNENWLKWIIVKNENGQMTTRTEDVPLHLWPMRPEGYVKKVKVPVTEEEKQDPLYKEFFERPMTAPDPSRYEEVKDPCDASIATYAENLNDLFKDGYLPMEKGHCQLDNGAAMLANITQMPGVTPEMFDWWFAWHGVKPLRYKIWDPDDHWSAQTRNLDIALNDKLSMKERYWDTWHDVVEDVGMGPENIIIHFRNPKDIGFDEEELKNFKGTIVCSGDEHAPCIMVHFLRPVEGGCELRTRFWFGYAVIDGKPKCVLPEGEKFPLIPVKALLMHNIKEFTNLAAILPDLYAKYHDRF